MDSPASHRELGISPFADSDESSSPSPVSTDHIPIDVLFEPTPGGIHAFFLDSDEDEQIGLSRVATEPDSDDDILAEILFHGQYVSGAGVVVVDKLPDDEIVDPRDQLTTSSVLLSESDDDLRIILPYSPKSSVHVLDLTNGKTVYMFVDKFYPIRAPLLERMLRHRLTVPPSYCRDVVVAWKRYSDDSGWLAEIL
ncbi:hypothetical protein Tco_1505145 [Tanacetum coccineum]